METKKMTITESEPVIMQERGGGTDRVDPPNRPCIYFNPNILHDCAWKEDFADYEDCEHYKEDD